MRIAIVDYGMGNLFSVQRACEHVGLDAVITSDRRIISESPGVILPGVGAFGDAMDNLGRRDLIVPLKDFVRSGRPFMGICLGMQLLFSESEEFGNNKGLNIFEGQVVRFPAHDPEGRKIKIPQVGWNTIHPYAPPDQSAWNASPLKGIVNGEFMYFVHSYYPVPSRPELTLSFTTYEGTRFCSSILHENVFACQFHPEKSGLGGLKIYRNWAESITKTAGSQE